MLPVAARSTGQLLPPLPRCGSPDDVLAFQRKHPCAGRPTAACLPCPAGARLSVIVPSVAAVRRAVVGEIDDEVDSSLDLSQVRAAPLKAIHH